MKLEIKHNINYDFRGSVKTGYHKVLLKPENNSFQKIIKWQLTVVGGIKEITSFDQFENYIQIYRVKSNVNKIEYRIDSLIETKLNNGISKISKRDIPLWCYLNNYPITRPGNALIDFYKENKLNKKQLIASLHDLSYKIRKRVKYKKGKTNFKTLAEESLNKGYGVCQDHTHIFLSIVRQNNIPCRYISGYFLPTKHEKNLSMHAWAEVYVENLGWIGLDVSNGVSPNERYVIVAKGFDYNYATPIKGIISGFVKDQLNSKLKIKIADQ